MADNIDSGYRLLGVDIGTATSSAFILCEAGEGTTIRREDIEQMARGIPVPVTVEAGNGTDERDELIPSFVDFTDGVPIAGRRAQRNIGNPNVVYMAKRLLGMALEAAMATHPDLCSRFNIVETEGGSIKYVLGNGTAVAPEDVLQHIAAVLIASATKFADDLPPSWVAASVPAYFSQRARQLTEEYIKRELPADVNFLGTVDEPTAAAIAFGTESLVANKVDGERLFNLVVDLGGGTFDVSLVQYLETSHSLQVVYKEGDRHLGGRDFDVALFGLCERKFREYHDLETLSDKARTQLEGQVEKLRKKITSAEGESEGSVEIDVSGTKTLTVKVGTREFERDPATVETLKRCRDLVKKLFNPEGGVSVKPEEINAVILVGGGSYMDMFRRGVAEWINVDPAKIKPLPNAETAVARGTCLWGLSEMRRINQSHSHPLRDAAAEAVAAMPVDITSVPNLKLVDMVPFPIGISAVEKGTGRPIFSELIPRGASYDAAKTRVYETSRPTDTKMWIRVREGDEDDVNKFLDVYEFVVENIPPRSVGNNRGLVELTFRLTPSRCLQVTSRIKDKPSEILPVHEIKRGGLNRTAEEKEECEGRMEAQAAALRAIARKDTVRKQLGPLMIELDNLVASHTELTAGFRVLQRSVDTMMDVGVELNGVLAGFRAFLETARQYGPTTVQRIEEQLPRGE